MIETILDDAERSWRDVLRTEYPLFGSMPVVKAPQDPKNQRHWEFYTDGKTVHMNVFKPAVIEKIFDASIAKMFGYPAPTGFTLTERLHHDNFLYLFHHETFHPVYCPDSKQDEEAVDKAIYEGIKKGIPGVSDLDALRRVGNARNAVWDTVIDSAFFYLANYNNRLERRIKSVLKDRGLDLSALPQLPDGVVTIFDVVEREVDKKPGPSLFYPLTRALYGLMLCKEHTTRKPVFEYFLDVLKPMAGKEKQVITAALKGVVKYCSKDQLRQAGIDAKQFERIVDAVSTNYGDAPIDPAHEHMMTDIVNLFLNKQTRYTAIEGFVEPLAQYISLTQEEKRHGTHIGNGSGQGSGQPQPGQGQGQDTTNQPGGNTQQAMINIANLLDPNAASQFLAQIAGQLGQQGGQAQPDQRLLNLATDEYYKRNVKPIRVQSPDQKAVRVELGKILVPELESTIHLRPEELARLNLEEILQFQQETGITNLFQVSDQEWRYDRYEWKEVDILDYEFEPSGISLPENFVFHVDSSGSMGSAHYVGTGSPYDTLMHIAYGLLKTVKKAATDNKKQVNVISANFSNGTILSAQPGEVQSVYDTPNNPVKTVLTGFQGGGTVYSPDTFRKIKPMLKPGKTVHVWVSDGGLESTSAPGTLREITAATQDPNTSFLYFEVGSNSSFGESIKQLAAQRRNVKAHLGVSIHQVQNAALDVLIQYADR